MSDQPAVEKRHQRQFDWRFIPFALLMGCLFFYSLDDLWPLAKIDLHRDKQELANTATEFVRPVFPEIHAFDSSARLTVDGSTLDYLERHLSHEDIQAFIGTDNTLFRYQVFFKKAGDPRALSVAIHPEGQLLGWSTRLLEESPGASLEPDEARLLAMGAIRDHLELDPSLWLAKGVDSRDLPARRRHQFTFERNLLDQPPLRERLMVVVEGDQVTTAVRRLIVPEQARLEARAKGAPRFFLESLGFLLLGIAGLAAVFVFFNTLRDGQVRLVPAARIATAAFICGLLTMFLQRTDRFLAWDALWPVWISDFQYLLRQSVIFLAIFLMVLVLVAAGDALDRKFGHGRGTSLWLAARLRLWEASVGRDCRNGFLLGLCCGAALTLSVWLLTNFFGATSGLQPRGFFFYALNASSPAAATLLFFLGIALIEECGYRFFGGTWLENLTGRRWLAILLPAIIYGLTHATLNFLPPAEPFWARAATLTIVGCVWGWGFFQFGALAVVVSHLTADLFIFNWPRLASGEPKLVVIAILTMSVPLIPVFLAPLASVLRKRDA